MKPQIIQQAAEAIICKSENQVIKKRISKGYRIPELDNKLRKLRTRSEARLIQKAPINVPRILEVDEKSAEITMEFIPGKKLSEHLDSLKNKQEIMKQIGEQTAALHQANIIHGDLTTSNMILVEEENDVDRTKEEIRTKTKNLKKSFNINKNKIKIYFIDFGLGFTSRKVEDKAVDIHLLKQALEAKHFKYHQALFQYFIKGYNPENKTAILAQLKKVESRGRYRKNG